MRRLTSVLGIAGAVLLAALGVTGCATASAASSISISSAYVPQPSTPGTTVAYLDIRNNGHADRLIAVHTSVGGAVQLRAPGARHAGTLTMHTVAYIPIPADSLTQLNPIGENAALMVGQRIVVPRHLAPPAAVSAPISARH